MCPTNLILSLLTVLIAFMWILKTICDAGEAARLTKKADAPSCGMSLLPSLARHSTLLDSMFVCWFFSRTDGAIYRKQNVRIRVNIDVNKYTNYLPH